MRFNFGPADIVRLIRQRIFWFAIPFALLSILGLAGLAQLPKLYESSALMIVADQQIPDDFVRSTVQTEAEQRLRQVRQEILARDNIVAIGDRYGVFGDKRLSRTEKHDIIKKRALIDIQRDQIAGARRDEPAAVLATIAFVDADPARAQRVANELVTQFQATTIEMRQDQAGDATDFLIEEEAKVRRAIRANSEQIAAIKEQSPDALPANRTLYENSLQRVTIEKSRITASIDETQNQIQTLRLQKPVFDSAAQPNPGELLLQEKRRALTEARTRYTESYPEVIALSQEVLELEREHDPDAFRRNARAQIAALGRDLAAARSGTPEAERLAERRSALQRSLRSLPASATTVSAADASFNSQLFSLEARLEAQQRQLEMNNREIADLEDRISKVPQVENDLFQLEQEQERLNNDLAELQAKRAGAERSSTVEAKQKGERLQVLEQPVFPDEPSYPDTPKLALAVFVLAAGLAGLLVLIPEVLFAKVQSKDHLSEVLPDVPVIEVPRFKTADERLPKLIANTSLVAATAVLGVALSWTAYQTLT